MIRVSVIIPVYNASAYVRRAVQSAVHLNEVVEILLVEDHSTDDSLERCRELQQEFTKVRLFQHPNGENLGAGASRNLGIARATSSIVAFLDADDYYLPIRFVADDAILSKCPDVDGVYSPIGVEFYTETGRERFLKAHAVDTANLTQHQTHLKDGPGEVYWRLIQGSYGYCSTIGLTFRKSVFEKSGTFNVELRLHQDTDLWIRIAYHHKLVVGSDTPVAVRGVHSHNRIHKANRESKYKYFASVFTYFRNKPISKWRKIRIYFKMVSYHPNRKYVSNATGLRRVKRNIEVAWFALLLLPGFLRAR